MPNWSEVLAQIQRESAKNARGPAPVDRVRRKYLKRLNKHTGRNVIAYYSAWLMRSDAPALEVMDADKNGIMAAVHGLDRTKGLDLILHTPGGNLAATESIVHYLHQMFGDDIRAVVPQLAMSAGTMISFASKSILMGKQSNLGPIDPQIGGVPAPAIKKEFNDAVEDLQYRPHAAAAWQAIIGKYHPTLLDQCDKAIQWSSEMARKWLAEGMFSTSLNPDAKATYVVEKMSDPQAHLSHARHIHIEQLEDLGLKIERLEDDHTLQDLVLTVHHSYMHTFSSSSAVKVVENHNGTATITTTGGP